MLSAQILPGLFQTIGLPSDGKPTDIESDEEFEDIQRQIWGELIYFLNKKKPAREKWNRHDLKKAFH